MGANKLQAEIDTYVLNTPLSAQLQEQAELYLPGGNSRGTGYFGPHPHFIESGKGPYVVDVDGNKSLDFMINATSLILGHANRHISAVIKDQIDLGAAYSGPTESQINLAEILCTRIPSIDTIRFTNSGTEATMMAIRAARLYTGKAKIVKIEGGYHGSHEYVSVSVYTPQDKLNPSGPAPIPEYDGQPKNVAEGVFVVEYNDIEGMRDVVDRYAHEIACVIMEPVVSSFGYLPADQEYLEFVRTKTSELGIVLIFDEVQTGLGRLGTLFGYQSFGVEPDIITLAKGLGGGVPIGAFLAKDSACAFDPGDHGSTFGGNPLTCAAAHASTKYIIDNEISENAAKMGEYLGEGLRKIQSNNEFITEVRGMGLIWAVEFDSDMTPDVIAASNEAGLLMNPMRPNAVRLMPVLTITKEEIDEALARLETGLANASQ